MSKSNAWKDAKFYHLFGYEIPVVKARADQPRRFYTELHKNHSYLASMGSDMPFAWMAVLETFIKRNRLGV